MGSDQRTVHTNGVDLRVESLGSPADPPILLIAGAAAPRDWWPDGFCERLASEDRFVIRYDHRDTGRSTSFERGRPPYSAGDLTTDAIGVLDALEIGRAHLVGASAGGGIAQEIAVDHPERVVSLTLISTSLIGLHRDLPPPSVALQNSFADPMPDPDWADRTAVVEYMLAELRPYHGPVTMDERTWRGLAERIFDRTTDIAASMTNHWLVIGNEDVGGSNARSDQITVPTLVLHGTADPLFPYPHGVALAEAIPGARLVAMEGVGHAELPPAVWDVVVPAIVSITSEEGTAACD